MEGQTNPASWPWFQLMSDALEGRLAGKAPRVMPVWSSEEDSVFGSSPPADRDCLMAERSSVSELESMVAGDNAEADGNVTYIDASGEECSTPSDLSYKSKLHICILTCCMVWWELLGFGDISWHLSVFFQYDGARWHLACGVKNI